MTYQSIMVLFEISKIHLINKKKVSNTCIKANYLYLFLAIFILTQNLTVSPYMNNIGGTNTNSTNKLILLLCEFCVVIMYNYFMFIFPLSFIFILFSYSMHGRNRSSIAFQKHYESKN